MNTNKMSSKIALYVCLFGLLVAYHGAGAQGQDQKPSGSGGLFGGLFGRANPTPTPATQNQQSSGQNAPPSYQSNNMGDEEDDELLGTEDYDGEDYDDDEDFYDDDDNDEDDEEMEGDESYEGEEEEMSPEEQLGYLLEDHFVARNRCAEAKAAGTQETSEDCKYLDELNTECRSLIQQIFP